MGLFGNKRKRDEEQEEEVEEREEQEEQEPYEVTLECENCGNEEIYVEIPFGTTKEKYLEENPDKVCDNCGCKLQGG